MGLTCACRHVQRTPVSGLNPRLPSLLQHARVTVRAAARSRVLVFVNDT